MKLQVYFDTFCVNFNKFCRKAKVAPNTVKRALKGDEVRLSSLARIVENCHGYVAISDFGDLFMMKRARDRMKRISKGK